MTPEESAKKVEDEMQKVRELFMAKLDVDVEVADILIEEGFNSLEEVAYVPLSEMLEIDAFDEDTVNELRTRARDSLEAMEASQNDVKEVSQELISVTGISQEVIEQLVAHQINTRDELAELAVDELVEMTQMDEENAKTLIMTARAHWFN
jgi:N utilization substance protein A